MKTLLSYLAMFGFLILGGLLYFVPSLPVAFAVTTTIIGWNVPNGTTLGHGIVEILLPIATMGLFAAFPLIIEQRGSIVVTMALIGLVVGNLIGMMSLSATAPTDVSFAFVLVSGMFLGLWFWKGGD